MGVHAAIRNLQVGRVWGLWVPGSEFHVDAVELCFALEEGQMNDNVFARLLRIDCRFAASR